MLRKTDSSIARGNLKIEPMNSKAMTPPIYMDHNATTPIDPRVLEVMQPFLGEHFGNASSNSHSYGWLAQSAVSKARKQVASLLGCEPRDVLWTSGATESNNMAILGVSRAMKGSKHHIITQATEHKAVLEVCEAAQEWGADVTVLKVNKDGLVNLSELEKALRPDTVLISIMGANNEVGTLQPVTEIAALCKARKIIFHSDAAQSVGKVPLDLKTVSVDMLSISGHKIYAPKGVGALILRPTNRQFELKPIYFGGDQERGLRPGTLNVAGIAGLGMACQLAQENMTEESTRLRRFQQRFLQAICERFPQVKVNGPVGEGRLCNNLSLSFPELPPDQISLDLSGLAYSSGSACNSASPMPSHVLKALGVEDCLSRSTLRLGTGRFTDPKDVETVIDKVLKMLDKAYAKASVRPL